MGGQRGGGTVTVFCYALLAVNVVVRLIARRHCGVCVCGVDLAGDKPRSDATNDRRERINNNNKTGEKRALLLFLRFRFVRKFSRLALTHHIRQYGSVDD